MISKGLDTLQIGNFTFVSQVNIIIGNKCTARCDFCTNESSPEGCFNLSLEKCRQLIKTTKRLGFKRVGFSGGEPFIYRKLLLELIDVTHENSLGFVVATNGYWGKDPKEAESLIVRLRSKGLLKLQLSYDVEHSKYVKEEAIYNVLRACKMTNVPVILYSAFYPGEKKIHELLDLSGFDNVEINEGEVINVGRAGINEEKLMRRQTEIPSIGKCPRLLQITVNFDGEIYPCCSVGGFSKGLSVGNLVAAQLEGLTKMVLSKTFVLYLQNHDANWIAQEVGQSRGVICKSVCELCNIIHSDEDLYKRYSVIAEEALLEAFFQNIRSKQSG